jgi:uncharacterized lipoprotein NlpE involved in copper resistance
MAFPKTFWLLATVLALVGCDRLGNVRVSQDIAQEYATGVAPHIVVETFNGEVQVERGAGNLVNVVVTKVGSGSNEAAAEEDLANIEVTMLQEQDTIRITAKRVGAWKLGNSEASVHLTVPPASQLELTTSNGSLTSHEITGTHKVRTSNGAINVTGGEGELTAETSNGDITLNARSAVVNARTSNGKINFKGSLASGDHLFQSSNGKIEITLPNDAAFVIDTSTSNGSVTTDFDLRTAEKKESHTLKGSVGDNPATKITARTGNGTIGIRRDK